MAQVYMYPATLEVIAKCQLNNNRKKVVIDTYALGLRFNPGTTYTIDLEQDFVKETEGSKFSNPAVTGLGQFTTNSTGPQIQTDEPSGLSVTNNTFIRYTYDRQILAGNGSYYLYKEIPGSPDEEVAVYNPSDSTANCVISGTQITLDTTGLIDAGETYYVLIDEGAVEDRDGLAAFGFDNDQEHRWTTAPSTNVDFPDLIALKVSQAALTCEVTKNPNYEYGEAILSSSATISFTGTLYKPIDMTLVRTYTRDTGTEIFEFDTPVISEPPFAQATNYTIEFTSSSGEFGDTDDLYSSYTNYSFTGTISQVNDHFSKIIWYPANGTSSGASLNATYTQKKDGVTQLTKTLTFLNTNNAIDNGIRFEYFESSTTFTPTVVQKKYKAFHFLVTGAGGGGAGLYHDVSGNYTYWLGGGGGGGGETIFSVHEGITSPTQFSSINSLGITIGQGGSLGSSFIYNNSSHNQRNYGSNGGSTQMIINYSNSTTATYTAIGGNGGGNGSDYNQGGDGGGFVYNSGTSRPQGQDSGQVSSGPFQIKGIGGAGAGAGDYWYTGTNVAVSTGDPPGDYDTGGHGFNSSSTLPWGDTYGYGVGGSGSDGSGTLQRASGLANYYSKTTNISNSVNQRGQGGTGSNWNYASTPVAEFGCDGEDGVVALKYF